MKRSHGLEIAADNAGIRVNAPLRNDAELDLDDHVRAAMPTRRR